MRRGRTVAAIAYDEHLAARIHDLLGARRDVAERRRLGGLACLVAGDMAIAASREGGVLVRVDPGNSGRQVATTGAEPMRMRGREMAGWLQVAAGDVRTTSQLEARVRRGVTFPASLPER